MDLTCWRDQHGEESWASREAGRRGEAGADRPGSREQSEDRGVPTEHTIERLSERRHPRRVLKDFGQGYGRSGGGADGDHDRGCTVREAELRLQGRRLPRVDPADPRIQIALGGFKITPRSTPKAAHKLAAHPGGAVLQGRLVVEGGQLVLADAGFQWLEPKPEAVAAEQGGEE